jgi:hypothetical protein
MFDPAKYTVLASTARLVKRVGFRHADEVIGFLHDWQQFMLTHEREPETFEEYVAWTRAFSRRTAFARLKLLRMAFPEAGPDATPTDFLPGVLDQIQAEINGADG